jgi:hypothetical protein
MELSYLNQIALPFLESQYVLFALGPTRTLTSRLPPLSIAICLSSIACNRLLLSLSNHSNSTAVPEYEMETRRSVEAGESAERSESR